MSNIFTEESVFKSLDINMVCLENRIESFKNWPIKSGKCTKEKMAKAGFYHCNLPEAKDGVRCFFCLQYLQDWEKNDDPQQEHLKHSKDCKFAQLNKDQDELTVAEFSSLILQRDVERMRQIMAKKLQDYDEGISIVKKIIEKL